MSNLNINLFYFMLRRRLVEILNLEITIDCLIQKIIFASSNFYLEKKMKFENLKSTVVFT